MSAHEFTLERKFPGVLTQTVVDALYEAGCDDATFCLRQDVLYAMFARDSSSRKEAIRSANADLAKVLKKRNGS